MKKQLLVIAGIVALFAFQSVSAGDGCCASKKSNEALKSLKVKDFASKEDKLKAYQERYGDISYEELLKVIKKGDAVIIDVNGQESYDKHHVTGAVPFSDKEKLNKALPKDKNALIIAYCGSPKCAAWTKAADYVTEKGYTNVTHYSEGIKGWVKRNGG